RPRRNGLLRQQVLCKDETPASLAETLRCLQFTKAIDFDPLLSNTCSQSSEVTVRRNETKAIKPPRVQEIHGVDYQRDIGSVLTSRVGKLLLRNDRIFR